MPAGLKHQTPTTMSTQVAATPRLAPSVAPPPRPRVSPARRIARGLWWTSRLLVALFLFVGALQVMKEGASELSVLKSGGLLVRNAGSTLGLGWVGALFVLSGSPIAASALTLVKGGAISEIQGFTMVTGSRLGAAFVVLLVAVIYALKGGNGKRKSALSTAVLALSTTAFVYVPGALIGFALLQWGVFGGVQLRFSGRAWDLIDTVYEPLLALIGHLQPPILFLGGLGLLLLSFKVIDTVIPEFSSETIEGSWAGRLRRKWPMFTLGCLVALVTMSVSVALTLLVPLVAKKLVEREQILPYIIGANIATLGDTLLAAFLLRSPEAVRIMLATITGTTIASLLLLAFLYPQMYRAMWWFQRRMVKSRIRLAGFTAGLFLVPLSIVVVSAIGR
ncbi:MAG: hypothetical protein ACRDIF_02900 [Actinomycetota bacterium]